MSLRPRALHATLIACSGRLAPITTIGNPSNRVWPKITFDTLSAARALQAAGIEDEHAAAIVGAIRLAVSDLVTAERFEAGLAELRAHTDTRLAELRANFEMGLTDLRAHIDTGLTETRAENTRARLALAGFIIGANALMMTVAGFVLTAVLSG